MFYGRKYAAYASINAVYRRTLNGVRSTGKKNTHLLAYAPQNATVPSRWDGKAVSVPSKYNKRSRDCDSLL